jgi:hypothetical protein
VAFTTTSRWSCAARNVGQESACSHTALQSSAHAREWCPLGARSVRQKWGSEGTRRETGDKRLPESFPALARETVYHRVVVAKDFQGFDSRRLHFFFSYPLALLPPTSPTPLRVIRAGPRARAGGG